MSTELGKKYPCFGDFKCPRCHKKWQSSKAWADYGQKCKSCSTEVMPSELQKLFVYICTNCKTKWNWAYESQGQKCKTCSSSVLVRPLDRDKRQDREFIKAYKLRQTTDVGEENHIDQNKAHRQDLCEKCKKFGRPCHQTIGQNYTAVPNVSSFSSSYNQSVYEQSGKNRLLISNNNPSSSFRSSSTYDSTSNSGRQYQGYNSTLSNNPASDSWCIIL